MNKLKLQYGAALLLLISAALLTLFLNKQPIQTQLPDSVVLQEFKEKPVQKTSKLASVSVDDGANKKLPRSVSQQGTDPDGALNVDAEGNFIADKDAWQLFEYFLLDRSLLNEDELYKQLKIYISMQLQEPSRTQALAFLEQYQNYYEAIRFEPVEVAEGSWREKLDYLAKIRRQSFGDTIANSLFGSETQQNRVGLAMKEGKDFDLDALPEPIRHQVLEKQKHEQLKETIDAMRAANVDEGQIWQKRADVLGTAAADRWLVLDNKRAAEKARASAYQQDKALLIKEYGNDKERIEALIIQHFSGAEQRKMSAKERLNSL